MSTKFAVVLGEFQWRPVQKATEIRGHSDFAQLEVSFVCRRGTWASSQRSTFHIFHHPSRIFFV